LREKPQLPRLKVVYDSECQLCLAAVEKLGKMKLKAELTFVPLQRLINGEERPWPGVEELSPAELAAQMHVTDEHGNRYSGAEGALELLRHAPALAWLAWAGRLPGLRGLSRLAYRAIANYRYRLFGRSDCRNGACLMPRQNSPDGGGHDSNH